MTLCPTSDKFANLKCIDRECTNCGVHELRKQLDQRQATAQPETIKWQQWEKSQQDVGKGIAQLDKAEKTSSVVDCIDELCAELGPLAKHHFNAKWQSAQYSSITSNVPEGCAVITLDFAKIYRCEHQDQPQAAYYGDSQVTIHPVVMHYKCLDCSQPTTDSAVFLSDSLDMFLWAQLGLQIWWLQITEPCWQVDQTCSLHNHAVTEKVNHAATENTNHAATEKVNHAVIGKANHAATEKANHAATEKVNHAVIGKANHAATEKANHAATEKANHAATEKANHAATEKANHAATEKANHAATEKANHAATEKANHAATEKANHAATEKANHAATEKANHAATEKANHAATEKANHAVTEKANHAATEKANHAAAERKETVSWREKAFLRKPASQAEQLFDISAAFNIVKSSQTWDQQQIFFESQEADNSRGSGRAGRNSSCSISRRWNTGTVSNESGRWWKLLSKSTERSCVWNRRLPYLNAM